MPERRDIVLVTVDSLRADHCGFMGYGEDVTPTLDEMARTGLAYEHAIAPGPATHDSVTTSITGEYPLEDAPDVESRIRRHMEARDSLPERLSRRGYQTAAFTANPWTSRHFGFDAGFDDFEDFMDDDRSSTLFERGLKRSNSTAAVLAQQLLNWSQGQNMFMAWEAFYDDIRAWLRDAESPFFLWVFLVDVHMPYLPPADYRTQSRLLTYLANLWLFAGKREPFDRVFRDVLVTAYDNTIRYVDAFLSRLLADLEADGGDAPLVVVHGDHGEEFGEHGVFGHGPNLSEEVIHVPLVVANGPTGTVSRPFSLRSLPDLVTGLTEDEPVGGSEYVTCRNYDPKMAVRGRDWKYVWRPTGETACAVDDESDDDRDYEALKDVCRDVIVHWRSVEAERQHITAASEAVARREEL